MNNYYNEHLYFNRVTIPLTTLPSAPQENGIMAMAGNLISVTLFRLSAAVGAVDAGIRILNRGKIIFPEGSGYLDIPLDLGAVSFPIGYKLEGPPWDITIQTVNASGAAVVLGVGLIAGDLQEIDTDVKILQTLERMLNVTTGIPQATKPKDWSRAGEV